MSAAQALRSPDIFLSERSGVSVLYLQSEQALDLVHGAQSEQRYPTVIAPTADVMRIVATAETNGLIVASGQPPQSE